MKVNSKNCKKCDQAFIGTTVFCSDECYSTYTERLSMNNPMHSDVAKQKLREANIGRKHSEYTKYKISESMKNK
ncbi:hypothetical protein JYQ62_16045 [Nostoc sp. UHCC 0702]|nr:hypothetical protein JYQ62_16045 [Nostoc sp. UHCC 0702]